MERDGREKTKRRNTRTVYNRAIFLLTTFAL
jgi:hypothetical protein